MKFFDNIQNTVKDDLEQTILPGSKISIAASCFSMYAYEVLRKEFEHIDELRFLFTSPTFTTEKAQKDKREFYIPRLGRERSLYGSDFELKLRNELSQKAIAKECAEWIRQKVTFKSNLTRNEMPGFLHISGENEYVYTPITGFTTADIGCEQGSLLCNLVNRLPAPQSQHYLRSFDQLWHDKTRMQDVTESVISNISEVYKENGPEFIYYLTLYTIFKEFLEDISEDVLPNEATGFKSSSIWNMLYNFQRDAVLAIINKLEKYNGCILADSVGLGKTFTALAVVKYYENRNKSVLVLCPKKLSNNWNTYKDNYINNPIATDRLRYDVLFHTDLSRTRGASNGLDLDRLNWGNYDLVVIDESHNFRNGGKVDEDENEKENRYLRLLNRVIRVGVKTKVLMLSATPVNNRFTDLKNQLQLAYEGDSKLIDSKLDTSRPIEEIFKRAQRAFSIWCKYPAAERTSGTLLKMLDFDFFEVLDSVTIARSRKHIEKYYDTADIGRFPTRMKPLSLHPSLTNLRSAINYNEIFSRLMQLNLTIYTPSHFIQPSRADKYAKYDEQEISGVTQRGREEGIRRLMTINLMKRLESSVYAFRLTLTRIKSLIENRIDTIETYDRISSCLLDMTELSLTDGYDDDDLENDDLFVIGKKVEINLADMDYMSWLHALKKDQEVLEQLCRMIAEITPEHDSKLQTLLHEVGRKIENPINTGNKKVIIFTAFADTAEYLYIHVSPYIKERFGLDSAMITGSVDGKTTVPRLQCDLNTVLTCFSPLSKNKDLLLPDNPVQIDMLIATDCISEGQNLQDCDYLINYDIHWNPVRIIQRFGRIDRIGSRNNCIRLVNFWPDITLDEYINLKVKVETRMKIVDMTATGDDNILSDEEKTDLEYRKQQLKRLQNEVVDMEEMSSGISIMDLGLNEFRLDLLEYVNTHPDLDGTPYGLHAVTATTKETPPGVIFILKNRTNNVNVGNQNRLHPFYMVYISQVGDIQINHLDPKEILDRMRYLCKGKNEPLPALYKLFNRETRDGRNMKPYSDLLGKAIASIIEVKTESELDNFLNGKPAHFLANEVKGLDDFELICFLVIK